MEELYIVINNSITKPGNERQHYYIKIDLNKMHLFKKQSTKTQVPYFFLFLLNKMCIIALMMIFALTVFSPEICIFYIAAQKTNLM
jgi:hypothetical protein